MSSSADDLAWATVTPKKCRHPRQNRRYNSDGQAMCGACLQVIDAVTARRGRNNRKRGQHYEREWARRLGLRHTGGLNKEDDAISPMFVGQAKSLSTARFPGWMALELDKLRNRWADRTPILGLLEAAGTIRDRKPRRLIVIDEADWLALHGGGEEEAT